MRFVLFLQFNLALFIVWPFYMLAVLLILMVNLSLNFTPFRFFTVHSVKLTKKKPRFWCSLNAEYATKEPQNEQTSDKTW